MARENHEGLTFKVIRGEPELVGPAKPTPHEFKSFSDIDDQGGLWIQFPVIQFYAHNPSMFGRDFVYYYPRAGRLRELQGKKLVVECTDEGDVFVESNTNVTLEQFSDPLRPPFPYSDELILAPPDLSGILYCPLLQVTCLRCEFPFAMQINHAMCDESGMVQFIKAVAYLAKGAVAPSVLPVWNRELLQARDPPSVTCEHHEFDEVAGVVGGMVPLCLLYFTFSPSEISVIRPPLPHHLHSRSSLHSSGVAMPRRSASTLRAIITVDARAKLNPPLPPRVLRQRVRDPPCQSIH